MQAAIDLTSVGVSEQWVSSERERDVCRLVELRFVQDPPILADIDGDLVNKSILCSIIG